MRVISRFISHSSVPSQHPELTTYPGDTLNSGVEPQPGVDRDTFASLAYRLRWVMLLWMIACWLVLLHHMSALGNLVSRLHLNVLP